MAKVALITGVTGFIGGALARRLASDGWKVHAVVRPSSDLSALHGLDGNIAFHEYDGTTECLIDVMGIVRPDIVFHLASLFLADHKPEQVAGLIESNLLFSTQLLEAMTNCECLRIINTGTSWQNYQSEGYRPVNLYAATKQAFQDIIAYYHDARGLNCITLKLFDTYGPGDKRRKLINILIDAAMSGEALDMSPGEQVIDLSHIEDVVSAFIRAEELLREVHGGCNDSYFVSGERYRLKDLVIVVGRTLGKEMNINFGGRPYRIREVMLPVDVGGCSVPGWGIKRKLNEEIAMLVNEY